MIALVTILILLVTLTLRFALQPQRFTAAIMDRVGNALGLEISASGISEYQLRGTPTLVVRNLIAREPGASTPLLRADRVLLSVPWSSIRARGADLTIDRIELDRPIVDLTALQYWLDRRPPSKPRIPTLIDGLHVTNGSIATTDWTLTGITLELPALHPGQRVAARASGRYRNGGMQAPFAVEIALAQPSMEATLAVTGHVGIERDTWRIPAQITLTGKLHSDHGWSLQQTKLAAAARYESGKTSMPFSLGIAGTLRDTNARLQLAPAAIAVRGSGAIPDLDASGAIAVAQMLELRLAGMLDGWPDGWPALPLPIGQSHSPLPFVLQYDGKGDLSDIATLQLRRDDARFDGRFHLPQLSAWIGAVANNSPLPPLNGHITTPRLEIAGAQLLGVDITLDDAYVQSTSPSQ